MAVSVEIRGKTAQGCTDEEANAVLTRYRGTMLALVVVFVAVYVHATEPRWAPDGTLVTALLAVLCAMIGRVFERRAARLALISPIVATSAVLLGPLSTLIISLFAGITPYVVSTLFDKKGKSIIIIDAALVAIVAGGASALSSRVLLASAPNVINWTVIASVLLSCGVYLYIITNLRFEEEEIEYQSSYSSAVNLYLKRLLLYGLMALAIVGSYRLSYGLSPLLAVVPTFTAVTTELFQQQRLRAYRETIRTLGCMMQQAHTYTNGHLERVALLGQLTALDMNMSDEDSELIYDAGLLHDLGKIAISESILDKPGKLDEHEWKIMRLHPYFGCDILHHMKPFNKVAYWIAAHHVRPDGMGYPKDIDWEDTPLQARIIAVVDAFDAMVGGVNNSDKRPYKMPKTTEAAIVELRRCSGTQFDPEVVETFVALVERNGV